MYGDSIAPLVLHTNREGRHNTQLECAGGLFAFARQHHVDVGMV